MRLPARRLPKNSRKTGAFSDESKKNTLLSQKEAEERKNRETNKLSCDIDNLREELNRTAQTKIGIFGFLKKTERPKEAEVAQKLNLAQRYLRLTETNFAVEQEQLRDEYEKLKKLVTGQMRNLQKEVENEEIDFSLEHRETACESLANAVNILIQRKKQETAEKKD